MGTGSSRTFSANGAKPGAAFQPVSQSLYERSAKRREARTRRIDFNGEWAVEIYFAVLTIVIVAMIVGLVFYTARYVIPEWDRHHPPRDQQYPTNYPFEMHSFVWTQPGGMTGSWRLAECLCAELTGRLSKPVDSGSG